jgi:choline dehydrogenase-like flavoprotein
MRLTAGHGLGVGVDVQRVLIELGRAVGVVGVQRATGAVVTVRARKTVIAAGAIGSPALLLRSGVAGPVGQYLRLHPATAVWGIFDDLVRPWTGTIQALYSEQFADQDAGYGVRFETTGVHPGFMALGMPWEGAASYDTLVRRLPHSSLVGILTRDRSSGRVGVTRSGAPVVRYAVSTYDQAHVRAGVVGAAEVLAAAGAREVWTTQRRYLPWRIGLEPLEAWMARVDRAGYGSTGTLYVSFHQMGTCRMGTDSATSVTDAAGQTHSVRDLYVADASLFPTASGVNPMVSVAALGHWVAQGLKAVL